MPISLVLHTSVSVHHITYYPESSQSICGMDMNVDYYFNDYVTFQNVFVDYSLNIFHGMTKFLWFRPLAKPMQLHIYDNSAPQMHIHAVYIPPVTATDDSVAHMKHRTRKLIDRFIVSQIDGSEIEAERFCCWKISKRIILYVKR